jgi:hypothetical protein
MDCHQVGQRHGKGRLRPAAEIEIAQIFGAARDEFAVDEMKRLGHNILAGAGRRRSRHRSRHIKRNADLARSPDARRGMSGETSQHRDAATASRQEHHAGRTG